jgi:endonuclease YncB( thermonuclease family)
MGNCSSKKEIYQSIGFGVDPIIIPSDPIVPSSDPIVPSSDPIVLTEPIDLIDPIDLVDPSTVPYFSWKGKTFYAKASNIYDGDTFSICWIWKDEPIKYRCRCLGYDSPEMKPSLSNPNRDKEKELAKLAKSRLAELLNAGSNGLIKVECGDFDKYGRILVTIWTDSETKSINQIMLDEGHGKAYMGGTKESWT